MFSLSRRAGMAMPLSMSLFARPVRLVSLAARLSTATSATTPVLAQLRRMAELQQRVGSTNSNLEKQRIITEFPDLRALLEQVYHPKFRTHLSSASLDNYLSSPSPPKSPTSPPDDITGLFDQLSAREVTGNTANDVVRSFLLQHGVISESGGEQGDKEALAVFKRLLDRNLVAGFGARTLGEIIWGEGSSINTTIPTEPVSSSSAKASSASSPSTPSPLPVSPSSPSTSMKRFTCALGKTILTENLGNLFSPAAPKWYASRKLDGVRVITFLDFILPTESSAQPLLINIQHLSRTGNEFTALGKLASQLTPLERYPHLRELLEGDLAVDGMEGGLGAVKRLVLDGEVCVMRPRPVDPNAKTTSPGDTSHPLWSGDSSMVEDFPATVSEIRRGNHTIDHPGYHLFDLLSWAEFSGSPIGPGRKVFSRRIEDLQMLGKWLSVELENGGGQNGLRVLEQVAVGGVEEVEGMVKTAAERGWEGLVLRADKPYKGARSSDVRKFKQWQDAEYTVRDIEISRQRLAINGVFKEYDAVAALVFDHKGHPVSVGSGMTAEQRVNWAKDPSLIIGKQMTVEYFSESEAQGREGVMSLRFPRIKTIWFEGKRNI